MQTTSERPGIIEGSVSSGLGRGQHFLCLEWVQRELREKIGLDPFPGTLNLKVSAAVRDSLYAQRDSFLKISAGSSAHCAGYLQRVILRANGLVCPSAYLIFPEVSSHPDILEIISGVNLREKLQLKDGDQVSVEESREQ